MSGDDAEAVISMLICCEYPQARRVRPAQGDGGIDVFVRRPDGTFDVFQIKRYYEKLTPQQKYTIKQSLKRLQDYAAQQANFSVASWTLVTPMIPMNQEYEWFAEQTANAAFPVDWIELTTIEKWAAKNPAIEDYYLADGRNRLEETIHALSKAMELGRRTRSADANEEALPAADTIDGLMGLYRTINELDPFYRYEFAVSENPPDTDALLNEPGLAFAASRFSDGESCVTFKVYPRFDEALRERPITIHLRIDPTGNEAATQALADFHRYGIPFTEPIGKADIQTDMPGGFSGSHQGVFRILSAPGGNSDHVVRLQILDAADQVIAATRVRMQPATFGVSHQGANVQGTEINGVFQLEVRTDLQAQQVHTHLSLCDLIGKAPADLVPGMQVLRHLHSPNSIRFAPLHGPVTHQSDAIEAPEPPASGLPDFVEDLALIQEHTMQQLTMPSLGGVPIAEVTAISQAAQLLRGETITYSVPDLRYSAEHVSEEFNNLTEGLHAMAFETPLEPCLNGVTIPLGVTLVHTDRCDLKVVREETDASARLVITPIGAERLTLTQVLQSSTQAGTA